MKENKRNYKTDSYTRNKISKSIKRKVVKNAIKKGWQVKFLTNNQIVLTQKETMLKNISSEEMIDDILNLK